MRRGPGLGRSVLCGGLLALVAAPGIAVPLLIPRAPRALASELVPGQGQAKEKEKGAVSGASQVSDDGPPRQVTVFAILATPNIATIDPRLSGVQAQLRKMLPDSGFQLLGVESKRLEVAQGVSCEVDKERTVKAVLVRSLDDNGKVQIRCTLAQKGTPRFSMLVKTPVNQLFFYDRELEPGKRILIGVGAR